MIQEIPGQTLKIFVRPHFNVIARHRDATNHQNVTARDYQNVTATE
jgi:hypothetical protein